LHAPVRQVDRANVGFDHFDTWVYEFAQVSSHLLGPPVTGHDPQERRRKRMPEVSFDDDDPMLDGQQAAEPVGDDLSADAASENHDGLCLCVCHGVRLSLH
jgi:hypothetical protein